MGPNVSMGVGIGFFLLWLIMMVGGIAAGVLLIVAIWKSMKAFESLARSMQDISLTLQAQSKKIPEVPEDKELK
ncbi:MAG: hypothetical protein VB084_08270 [Syntrophomonadaceae bacterium]|nr:hypothetical protein [Syntrophomonadaceae bacterium]